MSLTSFSFFEFLLVALLVFYCVKPIQKYTLLAASIYFYFSISSITKWKLCVIIVAVGLIAYLGAIAIDKASGKLKGFFLLASVLFLAGLLVIFKYAYNVLSVLSSIFNISGNFSWIKFASIIGISYYALTAIGYLVEVYWGNMKSSKNPADVFLFVFYFPQLISGPLTKYGEMHPQFSEMKTIKYDNISMGLRRMAWGYFKKLVISERFGIIVTTVYGNYTGYSMVGIIGATLCYAVQLYTDFSGCMDIIMGTSMLFGIYLPENFKAPFFSESIQEFWQRWHITLGVWFKDYLMYPLQKSKGIQYVGKVSKQILGKKKGKKIPFYFAMVILWICIGIWHGGTGYYFIASAGIPCIYLILSDVLHPVFVRLANVFRINTECISWKWFRRIRTLLLICVCWMVVCANGTHAFIQIVKHMISTPVKYTAINNAFETFGLGVLDLGLMIIGVVLLFFSDLCIYKGKTIFEVTDEQNYLARLAIIYIEVVTILMHGLVGTSSFIYFQF